MIHLHKTRDLEQSRMRQQLSYFQKGGFVTMFIQSFVHDLLIIISNKEGFRIARNHVSSVYCVVQIFNHTAMC